MEKPELERTNELYQLNLQQLVTLLSKTAPFDSEFIKKKAGFIYALLHSFWSPKSPYTIEIQSHCVQFGKENYSFPIIVVKPISKAKLKSFDLEGKVLSVVSHYDTIRDTPGADDNNSAVAINLLLAIEALKGNTESKVEFAFVPCEEPPFFGGSDMGSFTYVKKNKERLFGGIVLEMLGYFTENSPNPMVSTLLSRSYTKRVENKILPTKENFVAVVGTEPEGEFSIHWYKKFCDSNLTLHQEEELPIVLSPQTFGLSDHISFAKNGLPAIMITDTAHLRNPNYHKESDLPSTLDYKMMAKVFKMLKQCLK